MAQNPLQELRPPLGTFTDSRPHPSHGGNPYSDDMRYDVITRFRLGMPLECPELDNTIKLYNPDEAGTKLEIEHFCEIFLGYTVYSPI